MNIVLIINFLSWEKKKKLPDFPYDSPALKADYAFNSGERESWMSLSVIPANDLIFWNIYEANSTILTSSLIIYSYGSFIKIDSSFEFIFYFLDLLNIDFFAIFLKYSYPFFSTN